MGSMEIAYLVFRTKTAKEKRQSDMREGAPATDNAAHRDMIADVLSPYGFRLLMAEDGEAAVDLVRRADPDTCLFDIDMPGLDWEVVRLDEGGHVRRFHRECVMERLRAFMLVLFHGARGEHDDLCPVAPAVANAPWA